MRHQSAQNNRNSSITCTSNPLKPHRFSACESPLHSSAPFSADLRKYSGSKRERSTYILQRERARRRYVRLWRRSGNCKWVDFILRVSKCAGAAVAVELGRVRRKHGFEYRTRFNSIPTSFH